MNRMDRLFAILLQLQARGQQRAQAGISGERAAELGEVLSDEAFDEGPGRCRPWQYAGRPMAMGCHHETVVRAQAVSAVSGNPPTWAVRDRAAPALPGRAMASAW